MAVYVTSSIAAKTAGRLQTLYDFKNNFRRQNSLNSRRVHKPVPDVTSARCPLVSHPTDGKHNNVAPDNELEKT